MSALSTAMLGLEKYDEVEAEERTKVSYADLREAQHLTGLIEGAFISGSYLTNPREANDIDVVCSRSQFSDYIAALSIGAGFEKESTEQSARYNTDDDDNDYELVANWRKDKVNLIVVNDKFYPAYLAAAEHMSNHPNAFQTRELRVQLHTALKNHIRLMWQEPTWRTYMLPFSSSDLE